MTPQEMEKLPKPLERTISKLELEVMGEVVDRIKKAYEIAPVGEHMLDRLTVLDRSSLSIKKLLKEKLEQANIDIDKIYDKAVEADYITHKDLFTKAGREYIAYEDNEWLKQLVNATREQTKEELKPFENITRTTGFNVFVDGKKVFTPLADYFDKALDKGFMGIASGAYTYSQAIGSVIDEMTNSGLRVVNYASGHTDRVEVAVRRALMTGVAQMTNQINESNAKKLNTDYFEVDWHPGARNKGVGIENHQAWQGKVYSKQEMITVCGEGDILGFAGINCYHIKWPFIKGISKRKYTDEWLEEQNKKENTPKEFNGKEYTVYDALQYQRKLERTIRKLKQEVLLLGRAEVDKDVLIAKQSKLQSVKALYAEFSKAMGLPQQLERWRVGSPPKYANLTMSANDGKMTDEDIKNINEMISFKSYILNEKLRNNEVLTEEERLLARGFDKAILKLPDYKGTVYRSVSVDNMPDEEKFNKEHQPGSVVIYPAFTSASLEVYDDSMKYLIVILSKHGKDMTEYNPGEQEILFKRGTMFYVTSRDGNTIYMEEP